jgi:hypothetical protein
MVGGAGIPTWPGKWDGAWRPLNWQDDGEKWRDWEGKCAGRRVGSKKWLALVVGISGYLVLESICLGRAKNLGRRLGHCWSFDFQSFTQKLLLGVFFGHF